VERPDKMSDMLKEERFDFISQQDKAFIVEFNAAMARLGYDYGDKIGSGFCWGKYMIIYTKSGVKSKKVVARIYIRETSIVLRFFFSNIDQHRAYLEQAPAYIKEVFTGDYANCRHDKDDGNGNCMFRKSYTLDGRLIEKCNGMTFEFQEPGVQKISDFMALFKEFYPMNRRKAEQEL
jgi:hypothetical protein